MARPALPADLRNCRCYFSQGFLAGCAVRAWSDLTNSNAESGSLVLTEENPAPRCRAVDGCQCRTLLGMAATGLANLAVHLRTQLPASL